MFQMQGYKLEHALFIEIDIVLYFFFIHILNQIFQFCKEMVRARPENRSRIPPCVTFFVSSQVST